MSSTPSPPRPARLDRFLGQHQRLSRNQVRLLVAQGRVWVDGRPAVSISQQIHFFSQIRLDDVLLQNHQPLYLLLHKPVGVVSAVTDPEHITVLDLIEHPAKAQLHLVGRLDKNTSGLLLLTNDSHCSKALTDPNNKVAKVYDVTLARPVTPDYIAAFERGIYFGYEGITTRPAQLEIPDPDHPCHATARLTEGRYHQIKRMFGYFRNAVVQLHRSALGSLRLDPTLQPGQWRELTIDELDALQAEGASYYPVP